MSSKQITLESVINAFSAFHDDVSPVVFMMINSKTTFPL